MHEQASQQPPIFLEPCSVLDYKDQILELQKKVLFENEIIVYGASEANEIIPVQVGNKIVGFGFLFYEGSQAMLMRIIDPDFQSRGIGGLLLTQIEKIARKRDMEQLISTVVATNSAKKALTSAGFEQLKEEDGKVTFAKNLN